MFTETHFKWSSRFRTLSRGTRSALSPPVFLAHLPAGYLLTKRLQGRWRDSGLMPLGLAASVLPDADLLWFYLVDHRRVPHHDYWTHVPVWWAGIAAAWYLGMIVVRRQVAGTGSAVFFGNVFLHLALDTIVGGIAWFEPFSRRRIALVRVPASHPWWVWNFVFHWTFALELFLLAWATAEAARHLNAARFERDRAGGAVPAARSRASGHPHFR